MQTKHSKNLKEHIVRYDNGQIMMLEHYQNNRAEGEFKYLYKNGQLSGHRFYHDGLPEGPCKYWHENGHLKEQSFYRKGKREGEFKSWYGNGQLMIHEFYRNGTKIDENFSHVKKWIFIRGVRNNQKNTIDTANIVLIVDLKNIISRL